MSKIKPKVEVVHIPSFREYSMPGEVLRTKIEALGLEIPIGMLDSEYYYTDLEGWGKVLFNLVFKSNLYKKDKFDCDNYALKAMALCAERYGLNTLAVAIGDIPSGRHAFNIFLHEDGLMLWEPNEGFSWSGQPFEIGENGYIPELVLV